MKRAQLAALVLLTTCAPLSFMLGACGDDEPGAADTDAGASSGATIDPPDAPAHDAPSGEEHCAKETLGGDLQPLEITLLLDVSSSMCFVADDADAGSDAGDPSDGGDADASDPSDGGDADAGDASGPGIYDHGHFDCTDPRSRWPAASQALRAFLSSADAAGLTVAVRTFGPVDTWTPPTLVGNRCDASHYETADYEATELPSDSFANRIAAITPNTSHPDATQTQTGAVIRGATSYTKARRAVLAGSKGVAMLLLTDGDPQGCDPSLPIPNYDTPVDDELAYAAATAATAEGLKLYVLNIGGTKAVLDKIAENGGTESAVTIDDPTQTAAIGAALESIRKKALSCTVHIPTPAVGTPDYAKLNVRWTPRGNGGAEQILAQSPDCADGRGWRYDDAASPQNIELCPEVCGEVTESKQGKLEILLGCVTNVAN